jgi:uncharacterized protein (DUF58 family)
MASLLVKISRKMSIVTHKRVRQALEGQYASVFKGRSLDFDDLRNYIPGDDVKDIDWKATARSGQVRIKRYVAIRRHNIMFVVDTGKSMAATAPSGESKRDIAVMAAGVIASVAQKHEDSIGLIAGDDSNIYQLPLKGTRVHVERILQYIDQHTTLSANASNMSKLLDRVNKITKRRMLLIVISDNVQFQKTEAHQLRRLAAQHELLFVAVNDLNPTESNWNQEKLYDVNLPVALPEYVRQQTDVEAAYNKLYVYNWQETLRSLHHSMISSVRIDSVDETINQIIRLLEEHKHVRSR